MGVQTITASSGTADLPEPHEAFRAGLIEVMTAAGWTRVLPFGLLGQGWVTFTADMDHRQWRVSYDESADVLLIFHRHIAPELLITASEHGIGAAVARLHALRVLPPTFTP